MKSTISDYHYEFGERPPAVMLRDACPQVVAQLKAWLLKDGADEVAEQLDCVLVVKQRLGGGPNSFTFLAFPIPRLTREQRVARELTTDALKLTVPLGKGQFVVELDEFGEANWFEVSDCPDVYHMLEKFLHTDDGSMP